MFDDICRFAYFFIIDKRLEASYWSTYTHFFFQSFKKGSCQLLVKKCAWSTGCIRLGGLSLPRKSVIRLTDRPDITLDNNATTFIEDLILFFI